jgi:hypothetical protein
MIRRSKVKMGVGGMEGEKEMYEGKIGNDRMKRKRLANWNGFKTREKI